MIVGKRGLGIASHAELRQSDRIEVHALIKVRQRGAHAIKVIVEDLSGGGCRVQWPHPISIEDRLLITLPDLAPVAAIVVWTAEFTFGCRFEVPLHPAVLRMTIMRTRP